MRDKKYHIYLTPQEQSEVIQSLIKEGCKNSQCIVEAEMKIWINMKYEKIEKGVDKYTCHSYNRNMPSALGKTFGGVLMDKEEILEKSRKENKNQDVYEKDVVLRGNRYSGIVMVLLATVFFIVQIVVGGGTNYGLYAIILSAPTVGYLFKYYKLRTKPDLIAGICCAVAVLMISAAHIYNLITGSTIL